MHNVLLHAAAAVLLFLVLHRMTGALGRQSARGGRVRPAPAPRSPSPGSPNARTFLSGVYFMLTLGAYGFYVARASLARYAAVIVLFALGLMAEVDARDAAAGVAIVGLLAAGSMASKVLGAIRPPGRSPGLFGWDIRQLVWLLVEKLPLLVLAGVASLLSILCEGDPVRPLPVLRLGVRLATVPVSYVTYLGQMFYPLGLAAHYPYSQDGPPAWSVAAASLLLLAITAGVILLRRRMPYLAVGWFWYLITLLPVIGIVPGGIQLIADRYTYITQIGLYVALVWAAADLLRRCGPTAFGFSARAASAALVAGMMWLAWQQTSYWHDNVTLWRHALDCTSHNVIAHQQLAGAGRYARSRRELSGAPDIMPDSLTALDNFGKILDDQGRLEEAQAVFERAVRANQRHAVSHYGLANVLNAGRARPPCPATARPSTASPITPRRTITWPRCSRCSAATRRRSRSMKRPWSVIPAMLRSTRICGADLLRRGEAGGSRGLLREGADPRSEPDRRPQ